MKNKNEQKQSREMTKSGRFFAAGISLGIAGGMLLGILTGNILMGLITGTMFGTLISLWLGKSKG